MDTGPSPRCRESFEQKATKGAKKVVCYNPGPGQRPEQVQCPDVRKPLAEDQERDQDVAQPFVHFVAFSPNFGNASRGVVERTGFEKNK